MKEDIPTASISAAQGVLIIKLGTICQEEEEEEGGYFE